jgi:hypothetical protein
LEEKEEVKLKELENCHLRALRFIRKLENPGGFPYLCSRKQFLGQLQDHNIKALMVV